MEEFFPKKYYSLMPSFMSSSHGEKTELKARAPEIQRRF